MRPGDAPDVDAPRWGEQAALLSFPGGPYAVGGLSSTQEAVVRERFGALADASPGGDAEMAGLPLVVRRADAALFLPQPRGPWDYTFDLAPAATSVRLAGPAFVAEIELLPRPAAQLWTPLSGAEFAGVFENVFRVLAAYALLARDAFLLHSVAIAVDDGAVVFYGPSGTGKSTMARRALATGHRVLSDDLNAVCVSGHATMVEKVPFAGDVGGGPEVCAARPVLALCRLRQGSAVRAARLTPASALAALVAAAPFVNVDPYRAPALEGLLLAVLRRTPVVELACDREASFETVLVAVRGVIDGGPGG